MIPKFIHEFTAEITDLLNYRLLETEAENSVHLSVVCFIVLPFTLALATWKISEIAS
jgi:hypothetical protein